MNPMDPDSTQPAFCIGKYQILEELPRGGMAQVYRAWDPGLGMTVAVKILADELTDDEDARGRFLEEARTAAALDHANVVRIFYTGEHEGRPYIVMEFLEGEDLHQAICSGHTGSVRDKLYIAWQTAKALEYVHERRLIHRDIKPHNVHIDTEGRVRVLDFGIAKRPDLSQTLPGTKIGSPHYMSPEQTRGETVTTATDVWSFGVTLYEMFTGEIPFSGETPFEVAQGIVEAPFSTEKLRAAKVPPEVERLISDCLAKDPGERPTASEIRDEIEAILDAGSQTAVGEAAPPPPRRTSRRRGPAPNRKPLFVLLGVVAVAVAALAAYWFLSSGPAAPAGPLKLASAELPPAVEGRDYAGSINVEGGRRPLRWSIGAGKLPAGLALRDGAIKGVPAGPGSYTFLVRVEDDAGQASEQEFRLEVVPAGGAGKPVIVTGAQLPEATAGQRYQQPLTAAGGQPPFSWTVSGGAMPPGLDIMAESLFGTPTAAGDYRFTLRATGGAGVAAEKKFELRVRRPVAAGRAPGRTATPPRTITPPPRTAAPPAQATRPAKRPATAQGQLPPRIQTSTGDMVLVPAGSFLSGRRKQPVTLPAFYVDRTEVTRDAYRRFCRATGRPEPRSSNKTLHFQPTLPVVHVTVADARAFAKWAGKRLPTRREWEKAARGTDGRRYPWGDQAAADRANVLKSPNAAAGSVVPVTSFSSGASPYGALQVAGNVWEYVNQAAKPSPAVLKFFAETLNPPATATEPWYTICGGSYNEPLFAVYACSEVPGRYSWYNIGFRCVKDPK